MKQLPFVYDKTYLKNISIIKKSIAALFCGAAMLLLSCNNSKIESALPANFQEQKEVPILNAKDIVVVHTDSSRIQGRLSAPTLLQFENDDDPYIECPDGFHVEKYDENEQLSEEIYADYGKKFEREKKWEAIGNVVLINSDGDTLKTEHLVWYEKEKRIFSDKFVRIIRPDQVITGVGLEADQDMKNWKILEPRGPLYFDEED